MSAAAKASGTKYVIAIAGATGNLGSDVTSVILKEYSAVFSRVIALVRDPSSQASQALAAQGAELHKVSEENPLPDFTKALAGVDAVIDILRPGPQPYKDALVEASVKQGVKVFFPSEYGVDRRSNYWGWAIPGWASKSANNERAREIAKGSQLKISEVYTGLFLEMTFGPHLGFDHANNVYTVYGPTSQRVTFTSKRDIGRALAELALLAVNPSTASKVPEYVRIAGDTHSVEEFAEIVTKVRGDGRTIQVKSEDLAAPKQEQQKALQDGSPNFLAFLRLAAAENELNLGENNHNELFNPGQSAFKWTTVADYAKANKL